MIHTLKQANTLMLKLFLHTICHKYNMFQSVLNIFWELLNINKACIKTYKTTNSTSYEPVLYCHKHIL